MQHSNVSGTRVAKASSKKTLFTLPDGTVVKASEQRINKVCDSIANDIERECKGYQVDEETMCMMIHSRIVNQH